MNLVSLFNPPSEKGVHKSIGNMPIVEYWDKVKYGHWKDVVEHIRATEDKEERDRLKSKVQRITPSGIFIVRRESELIEHSNFLCIDFDYQETTQLLKDPYTAALHKSCGGRGTAVYVKINPAKHKDSFRFLRNYYFKTYGFVADPAPSAVSSTRNVSFDPGIFINEKSQISKAEKEKVFKQSTLPVVLGDQEVGEMIGEVSRRGLNLAPDYESYFKIGRAIIAGFGEAGRSFFHTIAGVSEKYKPQTADRDYTWWLKHPGSKITVGTLYYILKDAGIEVPEGNKKSVRTAAIAKQSGTKKPEAIRRLTELNGNTQAQAEKIVEEVYNRGDIDPRVISADPQQLIENLVEWLRENHPFRYNDITHKYEIDGARITNRQMNSIYLRARSIFNTPNVNKDLVKDIIKSDFTPSYNPLREFLEKNRHRKPKGIIDEYITLVPTDTPKGHIFIRKWLLSLIAAIHGSPVRYVLVLTGQENRTGKTEFFRHILPDELNGIGGYYGESKMLAGKDDDLLMCEKLILMDDEFGGKSKQDEKNFKQLTSREFFSLRAPYGEGNEDFKRLAVLCGTSNETELIHDRTGNSRILPVHITAKMDWRKMNAIDRTDLFIELLHEYEAGADWHLNEEEHDCLTEISTGHTPTNYERELILKFFRNNTEDGGSFEEMTATDVKNHIELHSKQQIKNMTYLGIELKRIFGEKEGRKISGQKVWVYKVVRIEAEDKKESSPPPPSRSRQEPEDDLPF